MAVAVGARFVRSHSPRWIRCVAFEAFDLGFARRVSHIALHHCSQPLTTTDRPSPSRASVLRSPIPTTNNASPTPETGGGSGYGPGEMRQARRGPRVPRRMGRHRPSPCSSTANADPRQRVVRGVFERARREACVDALVAVRLHRVQEIARGRLGPADWSRQGPREDGIHPSQGGVGAHGRARPLDRTAHCERFARTHDGAGACEVVLRCSDREGPAKSRALHVAWGPSGDSEGEDLAASRQPHRRAGVAVDRVSRSDGFGSDAASGGLRGRRRRSLSPQGLSRRRKRVRRRPPPRGRRARVDRAVLAAVGREARDEDAGGGVGFYPFPGPADLEAAFRLGTTR